MKPLRKVPLFFFFFLLQALHAQTPVVFSDPEKRLEISHAVAVLEDREDRLSASEALHSQLFKPSRQRVPNLGIGHSAFWVKFSIKNTTDKSLLLLELAYPLMDEVELYETKSGGPVKVETTGDKFAFHQRRYKHQNFLFDLHIPRNKTATYLLRVRSGEQVLLPLAVGHPPVMAKALVQLDSFSGIYFGVILVLFFYNLLICITIRDRNYLYYIIYTLFIGLTQIALHGYHSVYLFPKHPLLANYALIFFAITGSISGLIFVQSFLQIKQHTPLLHRGFSIFFSLYFLAFLAITSDLLHHKPVFLNLNFYNIGYTLINISGLIIIPYILFIAIKIAKKGNNAAKLFLAAWAVFLAGLGMFVAKDFGLLPYNNITIYTMQTGSAIEGILLSFALGSRINSLKREKEISQAQAIRMLEENERIIREQNVMLEAKVHERTNELKTALQMKALRAQMNPHFTFNVMNSIQRYLLNNDPEAAQGYLERFSRLLRSVLQQSEFALIPLAEELESLRLYLELESLRCRGAFGFAINTGEDVDPAALAVPSMLLQPHVENAINHGLAQVKEGGYIAVSIRKGEGVLLCTIEDNGIGREAAARMKQGSVQYRSMGTHITEQRIRLLNESYGNKIQTRMEDLEDETGRARGTRVEIAIPLLANA